jgi:hypothetical protein
MYSWRARQCCDSPGLADTGGKLLTALRKSSTVWRQVATDADRTHPLLPVAIRCQAVDCDRENVSTVWRQVATDADRSPPLLPVAIRSQAVDCARENVSTVWRQVATDAKR